MAPKAPKLTASQITSLSTDQSFERGQQYFRQGAITNPVHQGNNLWADCEGTDVYHPRATLGPEGVESSSCTCPYDWGGICKHQVALLLPYIHEPKRFQELPPLPQLLAKCSREDLLHMIEQMVQIHPDLISVSLLTLSNWAIDGTLHPLSLTRMLGTAIARSPASEQGLNQHTDEINGPGY